MFGIMGVIVFLLLKKPGIRSLKDRMAILNALNSMTIVEPSIIANESFVLKIEERRKNVELLKRIFLTWNQLPTGETDTIVRSLLATSNNSGSGKPTKFIFSRSLDIYYNNAYRIAVDCATELGMENAAKMLFLCLRKGRAGENIKFSYGKFIENSLKSPAVAA